MADSVLTLDELRAHARAALDLALKSSGPTRVGAVIVRGSEVLSFGYRGEREGLHAEQVALENAAETGAVLVGAVMVTSLEPCANSRTGRIPCAELISTSGLRAVYVGCYDINPQVYRLGWRYLTERDIQVLDFPADLRAEAIELARPFASNFVEGLGARGRKKFDFTQNGGRFTIRIPELDQAVWETRWGDCGADAIYALGGVPGVVAHARYATDFRQIHDPDALDYASHFARIPVGEIAVFRNAAGHALCRVEEIEPTADYGGGPQVSVKISWEVRNGGG